MILPGDACAVVAACCGEVIRGASENLAPIEGDGVGSGITRERAEGVGIHKRVNGLNAPGEELLRLRCKHTGDGERLNLAHYRVLREEIAGEGQSRPARTCYLVPFQPCTSIIPATW